MYLKDDFKVLILTSKLSQIWNIHLYELNEFLTDETYLTLQSQNNGINKLWVFEDVDTFLLGITGLVAITLVIKHTALEVALVEDQIKKINDIDLHSKILPFYNMVERVDQWLYDSMGDFSRDRWILYILLE